MNELTIFYDARCGLCRSFRDWLMQQPLRVRIGFVPYDSPEALQRFPRMLEQRGDQEIIVMADDGRWWQGAAAWLTCLWATHEYLEWSYRLARPALRPMVGKMVKLISANRLRLSMLLRARDDDALIGMVGAEAMDGCPNGRCSM